MAYIPEYEYDIFFSYAHLDNKPLPKEDTGWITDFYQYLELMLTKRCGRNGRLKIWWDSRELDGNVVFDDSIAEGIEKSAILICFNSTCYEESDYCQKELQHFYKKAKEEETGIKVGHRSRIVHVLLENIDHTQWPEVLKKDAASGFPFFEAEKSEELGDAIDPESQKFKEKMKEIRNAVWTTIDSFLKEKEQAAEQTVVQTAATDVNDASGDIFTIYFGEVNDSLEDRRDGIISELKAQGHNVITGVGCGAEAAVHREETAKAIKNADLAVHLLGEFPGKKIKDAPDCRYMQQEVEIGLEAETPQLIWIPEELDIEKVANVEHKSFLKELQERTLSAKKYDFVSDNEGELAMLITGHVKQLQEEQQLEELHQKTSGEGALTVLLDTHIDDCKEAHNLKKILANHNIDLIFNTEDGDPLENIKSIYENIGEAKKFIFLYGNKDHKDWIDIRVNNTLKKLLDFKRYGQDIFICMAPPQKQQDAIEVAKHPLVKLIDFSDKKNIDDAKLKQLLSELNS